ncbi:hypothetical protein BSKO_11282 [Bryopsis sp. KO-2023]|nr:hypothetical protein BSKO_11282 [Bryopsis sp. KO-2023]
MLDAADQIRKISLKGVGKFVHSKIPFTLVQVARNEADTEVVCACLAALLAMSVWPSGRSVLGTCGCLEIVERCVLHDAGEVMEVALEVLANVGVDKAVQEYFKATQVVATLIRLLGARPNARVRRAVLTGLVNVCLNDRDALISIAKKDLALDLLEIACSERGTVDGHKAALLLSYLMEFREVKAEVTAAASKLKVDGCDSRKPRRFF